MSGFEAQTVPVPTDADLADVHGWLASWVPGFMAERFGQGLWDAPGGCPDGYWRSLRRVPDPLQATNAHASLLECLKNTLRWPAKRFSGVTLAGPTGTGKTTLMCAFWHDLAHGKGWPPSSWWHARHLARHLTDPGASPTERNARLASLTTWPAICIDDLGTEPATDWTRELFQELIEDRHANGLPFFATTNLTKEEMVKRYSQRTVERLQENTKLIPMLGESKRTKQ